MTVRPDLSVPARRFVWCSAGGRVLHGRTRPGPAPAAGFLRRLLGGAARGGTIYEFEAIERAAALAALEAHLSEPGAFSIETAEGARLDFLASRSAENVTIDCWFFEAEVDVVVIEGERAREVVGWVYDVAGDREVGRRLVELAGMKAA